MSLASIIVPQALAGLSVAISSPYIIFSGKINDGQKQKIIYSILTFCLFPFLHMLFHIKIHYINLKIGLSMANRKMVEQRDIYKYHLRKLIKLELGLETILQLSGSFILFFNAISETKTTEGLNQIFKNGIDVTSQIVLTLSILWSFNSCVLSHINGLKCQREHFPFKSKIIAALYTAFACTKRIISIVLYFTPPLGLFSLLRHLQAENTPWHPDLDDLLKNDTIQFGNSPPIHWSNINRWHNDTKPLNTLYTIASLKSYFILFWILFICHVFVIFLVKRRLSESFLNKNILEKLIHCIENTNIPYNDQEQN